MKPLDKYKLSLKLKYAKELAWNVLVKLSYIFIALFLLITVILFWEIMAFVLLDKGIDIIKSVSQAILIIMLMIVIIVIDKVKNLSVKNGR